MRRMELANILNQIEYLVVLIPLKSRSVKALKP